MENRITDIEIHLSHLEHTIQELNEVVYRQQQAIDRLEDELKALRTQFLAVAPSPNRPPDEETPPPHY